MRRASGHEATRLDLEYEELPHPGLTLTSTADMSLLRSAHRPYSHLDNDDDLSRYLYRNRTQDRSKRSKKIVALVVFLLVVLLIAVVAVCINVSLGRKENTAYIQSDPHSSAAFEEALVVRTNCGEYVGTVEDGAFVFKGIPYAKPPTGHLRWKKPVPLWKDKISCERRERMKAHRFPSPCFQLNPFKKQYEGMEDCLYLNVWTPRLDTSAGLEVMVWIHGGFHQFGSGNQEGLSPSGRVAKDLNAVFVSFNYRLHALGFMALDSLVDNFLSDSFGNYGIWDQIVLLQWIKINIRIFGGDPEKVTVFGPDSGAASILTLMSARGQKDLFHAAWLIGPAFVFNRTFDDFSMHNQAFFLPRSGCADASCLRKMSPKEVIGTYLWKDEPSFRVRDQNDLPIQGIYPEQYISIDGDLLDEAPTDAIQDKKVRDIPILVGSAAQAVNVWPGPDDLPLWSWRQLRKYVTTSLDSFGPRISHLALQLYNESNFNEFESPEEVYSTMVTDLRQTCAVNDLADILAENFASPVYRYIVRSRPSKPIKLYTYASSFSFHLWDVIAFFDHMETFLENPTSEDLAYRNIVQKAVMTFVRSEGASIGFPEWKRYPENLALLAHNVSVVESYHRTKCKFWAAQNFTEYAWVS